MQTTPSTLLSLLTVLLFFVAHSIRSTQGFSVSCLQRTKKSFQDSSQHHDFYYVYLYPKYHHQHARSSSSFALQGMNNKSPFDFDHDDEFADGDDDGGGHFDSFDVEAARRKLESLVGESTGGSAGGTSSSTMNTLDPGEQPPSSLQQKSRSHHQQHQQTQQQIPHFFPRRSFSIPSLHDDESSNDNDDTNSDSNSSTLPLPPLPPLTSIDRERKQAEMELLRQLNDSDDALPDLWNLWFYERGPAAGARLLAAEELAVHSDRKMQNKAEDALKELMREYGLHWGEPVHRLATLYYQQGRLLQAEELFRTVLAVKPWHVGALSGLVVSYAERHAVHEARRAAALRLPKLASAPGSSNRRRQQWVARAVAQAEAILAHAEERLRVGFGQEDEHVTHHRWNVVWNEIKVDSDKDAWQ